MDRDAAAVARATRRSTYRALDLTVEFAAGEEMRTEISAKFREDRWRAELAAAGLRLAEWWTDAPATSRSRSRPPEPTSLIRPV